MAEVLRTLEIVNEKGLHARAAAKFVETVEQYASRVEVFRDGQEAFGDSIMGLLMLAASQGTSIEIKVVGTDAETLADALEDLVKARFHEDF